MHVIIFDLDGTLMNTLDDLHDSVMYALKQEGLQPIPKIDTRRYLGNGIKSLIWKSVNQSCPSADEQVKERVLSTFRAYYVAHSMDKTAPYEGVLQMLKECKEQGFITAIVSNKLDAAVKDLYHVFFEQWVDVAIGETSTVKRKPAPDMVNEAIRQLSLLYKREINKRECVYVGDSEVDIQTALNSELPCIAVSWGFRDRNWLMECGANHIIDHPSELFAEISSL